MPWFTPKLDSRVLQSVIRADCSEESGLNVALMDPLKRFDGLENSEGPAGGEAYNDGEGQQAGGGGEGGHAEQVEGHEEGEDEDLRAGYDAQDARRAEPCCFRPLRARRLARPRHDSAQDMVDPRRIAFAIFPEPIIDVAIQAGSDQHFGRSAELRQLIVGQRRNI